MTDEREVVTEVVRANAASLLRLARRHSLCDDDAADAYQRTLVIYLERAERVDRATAGAWLRTVCKHEAMRLRAARQRVAPADPLTWDEQPAADPHDAEARAESLERVARAAEALQACSAEEAQALLLRADGASYAEIGELCGWSYSRVNRALTDGRKRFLSRFARIESGAACAGHLPFLSAIVDGEATPEDYMRLRPHLRHCTRCRSALKAMYESEPALGALVPAGGLAATGGGLTDHVPGIFARLFNSLGAQVGDRVARGHALLEAATASKAAAVVASTAAVAGGAAVAEREAPARAGAVAPSAPAERAAPPVRQRAIATPDATATAAVTPEPTATPRLPPAPTAPTPTPTPTRAATKEPTPAPTAETFQPVTTPVPGASRNQSLTTFERGDGPDSTNGGGDLTFER